MRVEGKIALITGASRGIGAAIAERFAEEGAKVVVNYRSSAAGAEDVVERIEAGGGQARAVQADVSRRSDIDRLVAETVEAFGHIDILVNNAGRADLKALPDITPEDVQAQFQLNVFGTVFMTQKAVAHMPDGGRVVNISSIAAKGGAGQAIYSATKAAMNTLTKSFAGDLGPRGITVNAVAPGATETDLYVEAGLAAHADAIVAATPLGRIGHVSDSAAAALFLASEDAAWITGEILQVSGGRGM